MVDKTLCNDVLKSAAKLLAAARAGFSRHRPNEFHRRHRTMLTWIADLNAGVDSIERE